MVGDVCPVSGYLVLLGSICYVMFSPVFVSGFSGELYCVFGRKTLCVME